jgi:hypothetical protein
MPHRIGDPMGFLSTFVKTGREMQSNVPSEFDVYDQSYSDTVDHALAYLGLKVDFFTRVKVDYFADLLGSLAPSPERPAVIDVGC